MVYQFEVWFGLMKRSHLLFISIFILLVPQIGMAQRELSDAQKKEEVYKMYREYKKEFSNVKDVSPRDAMELFAKGEIVFIDTRRSKEINISKLPGAILDEEYFANPDQYQEKTAVAYCTISYRSGLLAKKMAKKGVTIYNLKGGILAWVLEGGKIYDVQGITKRIHVYDKKWDYAPAGYEPVIFSTWEKLF